MLKSFKEKFIPDLGTSPLDKAAINFVKGIPPAAMEAGKIMLWAGTGLTSLAFKPAFLSLNKTEIDGFPNRENAFGFQTVRLIATAIVFAAGTQLHSPEVSLLLGAFVIDGSIDWLATIAGS